MGKQYKMRTAAGVEVGSNSRSEQFGKLVQKRAKLWRKANNAIKQSELNEKRTALVKKINKALQNSK